MVDFAKLTKKHRAKLALAAAGVDIATLAERNFEEPIIDLDTPPKIEPKPIVLSDEQERVLAAAREGGNILITGGAGTGKSTLLKQLVLRLDGRLPVTASTGIAAVGVEGVTIHSYAGLGLGDEPLDTIIEKVLDRRRVVERLRAFNRLAIDEISMVSADLLNKLDGVLKAVRKNHLPFGGTQIIAFGDFCLKIGTEIIMADGRLRRVENVAYGDLVMGPDSLPRRVVRTFSGSAPLYRVKQTNGDDYTVTGNHLLAIRRRRQAHRFPKTPHDTLIPAKDMATKSDKFREVYGGYKAGLITLPFRPLKLDPYFLGMWLGDGEKTCARITSADWEIVEYCQVYAASLGLMVKIMAERVDSPCMRISLTTGTKKGGNPIHARLKEYGVIRNKHIPEDFLINSEENRLALLAGLLDTDGCWSGNRFIYCSTLDVLAKQVKQLADHLGFRAALRRNSRDAAWEVSIGGDTWRIPTKIKRKQSQARSLGRSRLNSTLKVMPEGEGEFFGFETDGDHHFLLADGTVTHNCQLPPVTRGEQPEGKFAFQSRAWREAGFRVFVLQKVFRQEDVEFARALSAVRIGKIDEAAGLILRSRYRQADPDPATEPVVVHTTNADVDATNQARLIQLPEPELHWRAFDSGEPQYLASIQKHCLAPEVLKLRVGAQVMLLKNLDVEAGLANGSIGKVVRMPKESALGGPVVEFRCGQTRSVERAKWEIKLAGDVVAQRQQIPLRLAWSITTHKSQGMTLDKIRVHLGNVFEDGQAYVALSRARTLDGLFIESTSKGCVRANPDAVRFYEEQA